MHYIITLKKALLPRYYLFQKNHPPSLSHSMLSVCGQTSQELVHYTVWGQGWGEGGGGGGELGRLEKTRGCKMTE